MGWAGILRARVLWTEEKRRAPSPGVENNMRLSKRCGPHRHLPVSLMLLGLLSLAGVILLLFETEEAKPLDWPVNPEHVQRVHTYVRSVLAGECRSGNARESLFDRLPSSSHITQPFLWKDSSLSDDLFLLPPPFGFRGLRDKVEELLKLLPDSKSVQPARDGKKCSRCVVIGNGGILRGLALGTLINRFDIVIRLNSGLLGKFTDDVGNRTNIRMSYPEGTPRHWEDKDTNTQFVAVVYKAVDINWISAMINRHAVALWDWLFFWQKVPDQIPLEPKRFRVLNPQVIKVTAMDLLHYPPPKLRLWGLDSNVPTLGVSALTLASLLCDEVSLAGFGYNLSQQGVPLHYYDSQPMAAMLKQTMHNVDKERRLLQSLVKDGAVTDLTGGLHCSFCLT